MSEIEGSNGSGPDRESLEPDDEAPKTEERAAGEWQRPRSIADESLVQRRLEWEPTVVVDERELEEVGAELDDPEQIVLLEGGADDPDGLGKPSDLTRAKRTDRGGWELDPTWTEER